MTETKTLDRRSQYSVDAIQNALFTLLEEKICRQLQLRISAASPM